MPDDLQQHEEITRAVRERSPREGVQHGIGRGRDDGTRELERWLVWFFR
jgi:hypothetical protein